MISRSFRQRFRRVAIDLLEHHDSRMGKFAGYFLATMILLSMAFFVLETTEVGAPYRPYFLIFDQFLAVLFTVEYIGRFWLAPNKKKFVRSPLAIIDLLVVISFYLSIHYFSILRGFRVFKIFQLLKIVRYSDLMGGFIRSFHSYRNEFFIFWITFGLGLLLSSTALYLLEHEVNESLATIPDCLWWGIVTITTVGYGDAVPITWAGKFVAGCMMVFGLATVAILTAVITKIFMDHFFGRRYHICDHCHYPHHDFDASFCKNCGTKLDLGVRVIEHQRVIQAVDETKLAEQKTLKKA
ncbi:MAG TPA: ion transporter [Candidatus Gracilibacteria bacterium]